jgi:hypothetical protein
MNAFIPQNPKVIVLVNDEGDVIAAKTNVDPELEVTVCWTKAGFDEASQGVTFTAKI